MSIVETAVSGLTVIEPQVFKDDRGFLIEFYQADRYRRNGIDAVFVQDNLSRSAKGVLRGLHIQSPNPQGKLVGVLQGAVLDVAVDVRVGSPTFGCFAKLELNDSNRRQVWIPRGFAHGFIALSESADVFYKCDAYYSPGDELVIRWDDPEIGIDWGTTEPQLSQRDRNGQALQALLPRLPRYSVA